MPGHASESDRRRKVRQRRVRRRRLPVVLAVVAMAVGAPPVAAGTTADPEITDAAGDANFVNDHGTGALPVGDVGTGPASLGGADLLAVWFETAYTTSRVVDAAGGVHVEHRPTDLLVHLRTAAPVHPTAPPNRVLRYEVRASLEDCDVTFQLTANGADPSTAAAMLWTRAGGCAGVATGTGMGAQDKPVFDGALTTLRFPLDDGYVSRLLATGQAVATPQASVDARAHVNFQAPVIDRTTPGRAFTIGQDVPADVDCAVDPAHPGCAA